MTVEEDGVQEAVIRNPNESNRHGHGPLKQFATLLAERCLHFFHLESHLQVACGQLKMTDRHTINNRAHSAWHKRSGSPEAAQARHAKALKSNSNVMPNICRTLHKLCAYANFGRSISGSATSTCSNGSSVSGSAAHVQTEKCPTLCGAFYSAAGTAFNCTPHVVVSSCDATHRCKQSGVSNIFGRVWGFSNNVHSVILSVSRSASRSVGPRAN